jgi:hypothetical protein
MEWQIHFMEATMCVIIESIEIAKKREDVFRVIKTTRFMKLIDANEWQEFSIQIENDRILRTISLLEKVGKIETEKLFIPEVFTIISQRRDSLSPFTYQIVIQMLEDKNGSTILKWIIEFEMEEKMKDKESYFASIIKSHAQKNLGKISEYFSSN